MGPPPSDGPQKSRKSMPPKTVARPYQFEALVIIYDIFAIRRFSGIPAGVNSAKRLIFVYVCEGFSYLCVFVKIEWVFVYGLMYVKRLVFVCVCEGCSYLCVFVKIDCVLLLILM